ncbi:MAG: metallophosphoesterase [Conexivisphaerales archaeon]
MTFKLFLASDVHGSNKCYGKFLSAPKFYGVDVLVMCGDITGKALVFLVRNNDGTYWCNYLGSETTLNSKEEMLALKKQIDDSGYYTYVCSRSEFEELSASNEKMDSLLMDLIYKRMEEWVELAEKRLHGSKVEVYILPGNDDPFRIDKVFDGSKVAVNPEGRVLEIREGHEMIATGFANMTPWRAPRDIEDNELLNKLQAMATKLRHPETSVFTIHPPPYGTSLDLAPKLQNFKPKTVMGQIEYEHVGSVSVRNEIEKYQPLLSLHGHVHESKAVSRIGKTYCFNAGSEYENGILRGVIIALAPKKVENYFFTAG